MFVKVSPVSLQKIKPFDLHCIFCVRAKRCPKDEFWKPFQAIKTMKKQGLVDNKFPAPPGSFAS